MLYEVRKISKEQYYVLIVWFLSMVLSFLTAYVVFRYWQIDFCKSDIEIGNFGE